jgi:protein TonB
VRALLICRKRAILAGLCSLLLHACLLFAVPVPWAAHSGNSGNTGIAATRGLIGSLRQNAVSVAPPREEAALSASDAKKPRPRRFRDSPAKPPRVARILARESAARVFAAAAENARFEDMEGDSDSAPEKTDFPERSQNEARLARRYQEGAFAEEGQATRAGNTDGADMTAYTIALYEAAQKYRFYPKLARARGLMGKCVLRLLWHSALRAPKVEIIESSGHALLDQAALESLRRAAQTVPFPETPFKILLPVEFSLE